MSPRCALVRISSIRVYCKAASYAAGARLDYCDNPLDIRPFFRYKPPISFLEGRQPLTPAGGARAVPAGGGRQPLARAAVERREAPRARSRRFAQADRSVARATPEARAGGNIRPRGVAHDPGASRRSTPLRSGFRERGLAKLGRKQKRVARTIGVASLPRSVSLRGGGKTSHHGRSTILPMTLRSAMALSALAISASG